MTRSCIRPRGVAYHGGMDGTAEDRLTRIADAVELLTRRLADVGPRFLSVQGAATRASLSTDSIRRLVESGRLTALRPVRGKVLIDARELDALILSSTDRVRNGRGHGGGR
ncbi:MAG TPA: excisionase family DNA-binding protein [Thermoguttaceae bacterium]|nr:excisionase family DNA-binding protein [Thermoguttaceae bacterium]